VFTPEERQAILRFARATIAAHFAGTSVDRGAAGVPRIRAGAFVTLDLNGELRGCIGYPEADRWLPDVLAQCAVSAAVGDPRFPALGREELEEVEIEVSVLGPLQPVDRVEEIEVGRDGLIVSRGAARGLLLPQVATERNWDRQTFLAHTCLKAGLPRDAWRAGATIERFEAEVFSERGEGLLEEQKAPL
jgi:AmmeMemoRadiSam system protein A